MSVLKPLLIDQLPDTWDLPIGPRFRRKQLSDWVFKKRANSFEAMTNLPEQWRKCLCEKYRIKSIELLRKQGSKDTTRKYLWKLAEGDYVESVLIPASPALYGDKADRFTLCVSSQVGCAYGCKFCASGLEGWKRNLSAGEIVSQIMETEKESAERISNLVFMGMGEPMANFENLMLAIDMINSDWGLNIGARKITISTSGLVPKIRALADQERQIRLAISLHGASDNVRDSIMPINRKYPISKLLEACSYFCSKKKQMITFEYILIKGINDHFDQAALLAKKLKGIRSKINLIPYNKVAGLPWERPEKSHSQEFAHILARGGIKATLRLEKGHDIDAACGQLRLKEIS
ncbi:MAG: 23S rRNA (adenine(2503)-C(2))-methyltransferase RlmN [Verrucomicrobiota bacterium]